MFNFMERRNILRIDGKLVDVAYPTPSSQVYREDGTTLEALLTAAAARLGVVKVMGSEMANDPYLVTFLSNAESGWYTADMVRIGDTDVVSIEVGELSFAWYNLTLIRHDEYTATLTAQALYSDAIYYGRFTKSEDSDSSYWHGWTVASSSGGTTTPPVQPDDDFDSFANASWGEIANACANGTISDKVSVGDIKDVELSTGEVVAFEVIDISDDGVLTLFMPEVFDTLTQAELWAMDSQAIDEWADTTLYNRLPADMRGTIVPTPRHKDIIGSGNVNVGTVTDVAQILVDTCQNSGTVERNVWLPTFDEATAKSGKRMCISPEITMDMVPVGETYDFTPDSRYPNDAVEEVSIVIQNQDGLRLHKPSGTLVPFWTSTAVRCGSTVTHLMGAPREHTLSEYTALTYSDGELVPQSEEITCKVNWPDVDLGAIVVPIPVLVNGTFVYDGSEKTPEFETNMDGVTSVSDPQSVTMVYDGSEKTPYTTTPAVSAISALSIDSYDVVGSNSVGISVGIRVGGKTVVEVPQTSSFVYNGDEIVFVKN